MKEWMRVNGRTLSSREGDKWDVTKCETPVCPMSAGTARVWFFRVGIYPEAT